VPAIDWSWPAERINGVLRAMWEHVELDDRMRPVRAEWLVPEWRAPDAPSATSEAELPTRFARLLPE
jgi:hypothetical protein